MSGLHAHFLDERPLRCIVTEYVTYLNRARPHRGIHQRIPCDPQLPDHPDGEMVGVSVLGGLHHDAGGKPLESHPPSVAIGVNQPAQAMLGFYSPKPWYGYLL